MLGKGEEFLVTLTIIIRLQCGKKHPFLSKNCSSARYLINFLVDIDEINMNISKLI